MIPIFFAVNDSFVRYLCTALESMKDYMSKNTVYDIHILYSSLSEESKNYISTVANECMQISFHNVDEYFRKYQLKETERWTKEIYYRLIIPYMFDFDKALYFDADIIFQKDPKELYDIDIEDNYIGAVFEPSNQPLRLGSVKYEYTFTSFWNLRCEGYYFGSGVLCFNLKAFRNAYTFEELLEYMSTHELDYMDQDTLNYLCLNHTYGYEPNWNCVYQYYHFQCQLEKTGKNLYIFHYAGMVKPDLFALRPKFHLFWKYYKRTPFYSDEEYIDAISEYALEYSDEIQLEQIRISVDETFTEELATLYAKQCESWCEDHIPLSEAAMYLLYYCMHKYKVEVTTELLEKYDYMIEEFEML